MTSAYRLPEQSTYTTRRVWSFAAADRIVLTETFRSAPKARLRTFAANHVAVVWDQDGAVVKVEAAGIVQYEGRDAGGFAGETWRAAPYPNELARFLAYPQPAAVSA